MGRASSTISEPARFLEPARAALGQPDKSSQLDHARASSKNRAGATGSGQLRPQGMVKEGVAQRPSGYTNSLTARWPVAVAVAGAGCLC